MSKTAALIYPHQLFEQSPLFKQEVDCFFIIEDPLFFSQYKFHKQKLAYHRATMKWYADFLIHLKYHVEYIEEKHLTNLFERIYSEGYHQIYCIDVVDDWLSKKIIEQCQLQQFHLNWLSSPLFINSKKDNDDYFKNEKKKYHHSQFYKKQRQKLGLLMDKDNEPVGGKWSFDTDNRKKYPAKKTPPSLKKLPQNDYYKEAVSYVNNRYSDHLGTLEELPLYPTTFKEAEEWLLLFLNERYEEFGVYEDAIVSTESFLNHSVISPMLNIGLLTPYQVINHANEFYENKNVPINSHEGFLRQIIGWREFIRGIYEANGRQERTKNFWKFTKKMPDSLYNGSTGIPPIDQTIKKLNETAYCHHIERLMVLGNFMLLCEIHPDEVYQWFMEYFIDAYDWVMVTNIYGMSQFSDGGLMASKPYISSSNYILKMSNYKKGDWQFTWDGLFWRFMDKHRDILKKNPRLSMLINNYDKMDIAKKEKLMTSAELFLKDHQLPQTSLF
ncbi:cryptochrome/photolyase family protein [Flammeovirga pacifica]|uniref:Cryptochrome/photolyase family protein n=1 Tax=Flammeovirga pacifica TaxID=915059 RepID=A0A1S1YWC7_FLAPC|nr:cryptochrome/photolyase family protein [Flammeovirga pacifica]OHX65334.1 cryptochrome/photolyase family protein [Flammeovirga pacifica]